MLDKRLYNFKIEYTKFNNYLFNFFQSVLLRIHYTVSHLSLNLLCVIYYIFNLYFIPFGSDVGISSEPGLALLVIVNIRNKLANTNPNIPVTWKENSKNALFNTLQLPQYCCIQLNLHRIWYNFKLISRFNAGVLYDWIFPK